MNIKFEVNSCSEKQTAEDVNILIGGTETKNISAEINTVCDETGSVYEWWKKIGSPQFINKEKLGFLIDKSKTKKEYNVLFKENEFYKIPLKLNAGDFALITLKNL